MPANINKEQEVLVSSPKSPARRGLGRGLSALIPNVPPSRGEQPIESGASGEQLRMVPLNAISLNPFQPRKTFAREELDELGESIRLHGILQPIIVRLRPASTGAAPGYELVAGERRFRAASHIGLEKIPAVVREIDDQESLALALIENIQRENLNSIEAAQAYERLLQEFHMTQTELAQSLGKSQPQIANALRLLSLPGQIREGIRSGQISEGHAKVILTLPDSDARNTLYDRIISGQLTVREAEKEAARMKSPAVPQARTAAPPPNPHFAEISERISLNMGTKVRLLPGRGQRGTIEIAYYDHDQLEGLLERLAAEHGR